MSYVIAAYGITAGSLLLYAIALFRERARLARASGQAPGSASSTAPHSPR